MSDATKFDDLDGEKMGSLDISVNILAVFDAVKRGSVGLFKFDLMSGFAGCKSREVNAVFRITYVFVLIAGVPAAATIPATTD